MRCIFSWQQAMISVFAASAMFLPISLQAAVSMRVTERDIGSILIRFGIQESPGKIRAVATNNDESHYGFLFDDGTWVRVFRDGIKIYDGTSSACTLNPYLFWMTDDGHLVYVPDCTSLYFDDQLVSEQNGALTTGKEFAPYQYGKLLYPEGESVVRFDSATGQSTKLYEHPGESIRFVRAQGDSIVYTAVKPSSRFTTIYRNGKKLSTVPVSNPENFLVTKSGDVYFFSESGARYILYKNRNRYVVGRGKGAFLFEDDQGGVWHVSYIAEPRTRQVDIALNRNRERVNYIKESIGNLEGYIAFNGKSFAVRAQHNYDDSFQLLKDGTFVGTSFRFDPNYKDYNGLFFGGNGKVYMRNYKDGRWFAYEDGTVILKNVFQNVWLIDKAANGEVIVYGTK